MTKIEQIRQAKKRLQSELLSVVCDPVFTTPIKKFTEETGMELQGIYIRRENVTTLGDQGQRYVTAGINVELESI